MKIVKNENIRPFDCDGCLIYSNASGTEDMPATRVMDPVSKRYIELKYNPNMVRLLLEEYNRGSYIIVWSRSGWEWAKNVVISLDLQPYVDRVMSKPTIYFDDTEVQEWMKDRVYIAPDVIYKR